MKLNFAREAEIMDIVYDLNKDKVETIIFYDPLGYIYI